MVKREQFVDAVESQEVVDAFLEDLPALLHQYSDNASQQYKTNPLTYPGHPISRPLCLLFPLSTESLPRHCVVQTEDPRM